MDSELIKDLLDAVGSLLVGRPEVQRNQLPAASEPPTYQDKKNALAQLRERLKTHHYRRVAVRGDGNCFFRAVSYAFYRTEAFHMFFREASVLTMVKNRKLYCSPGYDRKAYRKFLKSCAEFGTSAQGNLIQACVDTFKMKLVMVDATSYSAIVELYPTTGGTCFDIYISHIPYHADALIPTADLHPYAIVSPEVTPLILALAMSRYAKYEDDSSDESDYIW